MKADLGTSRKAVSRGGGTTTATLSCSTRSFTPSCRAPHTISTNMQKKSTLPCREGKSRLHACLVQPPQLSQHFLQRGKTHALLHMQSHQHVGCMICSISSRADIFLPKEFYTSRHPAAATETSNPKTRVHSVFHCQKHRPRFLQRAHSTAQAIVQQHC